MGWVGDGVRGKGWVVVRCGAVPVRVPVPVCLWTVVLRPVKELGRFQIAILGPLSRERGGGAFLPGACLHVAAVGGPEWIESSLASRMGNMKQQAVPVALLCLCCVGLQSPTAGMLGGWISRGPGGMKRAGPEFTFPRSLIRSGEGHHWKSHSPPRSTTRRSATQRKGMARQQQVRCTTRGTGRRSGTTRRMAWRRVSKPTSRYARTCCRYVVYYVLWSLALLIAAAPPDPRDTPHVHKGTSSSRYDVWLSDHTQIHPRAQTTATITAAYRPGKPPDSSQGPRPSTLFAREMSLPGVPSPRPALPVTRLTGRTDRAGQGSPKGGPTLPTSKS